jgi:hypothetical protein
MAAKASFRPVILAVAWSTLYLALGVGDSHAQCDLYKRLMTITDSLYVRDDGSAKPVGTPPAYPAPRGYTLAGQIWEGGLAGTGWQFNPYLHPGWSLAAATEPPPVPEVHSFIDQHLPEAVPFAPDHGYSSHTFTLSSGQADPKNVGYITTSGCDNIVFGSSLYLPQFDIDHPTVQTFNIQGRVVWMLRDGLRIDGHVIVHGDLSNDCLVIVAGTSKDHDTPPVPGIGAFGIEFSAGIESNIPVILVTDGWFFNEQFALSPSGSVPYLSVFARAALFWGSPDFDMDLFHPGGSSYDNPGDLIDELCEQGALPNAELAPTKRSTWGQLKQHFR